MRRGGEQAERGPYQEVAGHEHAARHERAALHLPAALLSPMMASASTVLGAVILAATGLYQLTPLKRACLERCQSP
ncbi:MAG: DUF2182 domain-containing protein, partial [Burkholderiales bacterium]|nr:DUF2182 domain-containing protein [Burkholderiales bacterium]